MSAFTVKPECMKCLTLLQGQSWLRDWWAWWDELGKMKRQKGELFSFIFIKSCIFIFILNDSFLCLIFIYNNSCNSSASYFLGCLVLFPTLLLLCWPSLLIENECYESRMRWRYGEGELGNILFDKQNTRWLGVCWYSFSNFVDR